MQILGCGGTPLSPSVTIFPKTPFFALHIFRLTSIFQKSERFCGRLKIRKNAFTCCFSHQKVFKKNQGGKEKWNWRKWFLVSVTILENLHTKGWIKCKKIQKYYKSFTKVLHKYYIFGDLEAKLMVFIHFLHPKLSKLRV